MAWETKRIKDFTTLITEKTTLSNKVALENIEEATGRFIETDSEFDGDGVHFLKDDILYGKLRPYLKKVWLSDKEGNAIGDIFVFRHKKNSNPNYLKWLFLSEDFTSKCNGSTQGAKMPRVDSNFILTLSYPLPPESTQQKIADFLDLKTHNIDARIELLEKKKERYTILRKTLINELVNGEGKNWKSYRLKDLVFNMVEAGKRPVEIEEDVISIGGKHIQHEKFCLENPKYVSFSTYENSKGKIRENDILVVKDGATIGKCMYVQKKPFEKMLLNEHVYRIQSNKKCINKFLFYFLLSNGDYWFRMNNMTTAQETIKLDTVYTMKIKLPSIEEQNNIIIYLDKKISAIDSIVSNITKEIYSLKTYRRALINEAVTGKLNVE